MMLPRLRPWGSVVVLLYLVLALVLKVTIRRTEAGSLAAVRVIKVVFLAAVVIEVTWRVYYAWHNGSNFSIFDSFDIPIQCLIGLVIWKNISVANSRTLNVQSVDNSNATG